MSAPLQVAIGRTPRTAALFADPMGFALAEMPNITRAFAPMVREGRHEVSELAIATYLMAKAAGAPIVLLPAVLSARHPEASLLARRGGEVRKPEDLRGRRVGVRAYSQTTALWLRGILAERHGLSADALRWVTFEDAHVAGYQDPPWCERAAPGADMAAMLLAGELDAAIFGSEGAGTPEVLPVMADHEAAAEQFISKHGFMPINHVLVARADVAAARPDALSALLARLRAGGVEVHRRAALSAPLAAAARLCHAQGLTERALTLHEIWAGTPDRFR
ncbi:ABC transporter substrate-binding protein [Roseococcus thiosulfatophilus]|uniref:ABC transporter substrate-binding protein n=1 Tax=Roseococcus thiosulfatophilus TaxID=35813 RepID=UPI001A8E2FC8|nr:ABC transporter substrate-binding protein [Roseococcus thiosulfatophilus]